MKKGFTLIELIVVIAIIGILSIIIVPSVMNVNKSINKRLLNQKIENIESGAILYASKNDDIFNGVDEVEVKVYELIDFGYVTIDVDTSDSRCSTESGGAKGCVLDPTSTGDSTKTLNNNTVIIRKQGAGYTAEFVYVGPGAFVSSDGTLVEAVCDGFLKGTLTGKTTDGNDCYCYANASSVTPTNVQPTVLKDSNDNQVNACIIAGENPNNYLKYGDSKPNWRVLGIYVVDGNLSAKMITSEPI